VLRIDLPASGDRSLDRLAQRLAGTLRRAGASATVALVIHDRVLVEPPGRLLDALLTQLSRGGVELVDLIGVGESTYRSLLCGDDACCAGGGVGLDDVLGSRVAATHVLAGDVVADDERGLVADVQPDPDAPDHSGGEDPGEEDPAGPGTRGARRSEAPRRAERRRWWRTWTASFQAGRISPQDATGLARALRDPVLRDAVMVDVLGAPPTVTARLLEAETLAAAAALLDSGGAADFGRLLAAPPGPVGAERMGRARSVLSAAARAAPNGCRADALATLAWLAWYAGEGVRARLLARRATADEAAHSLALLVDELLAAQIPPPWATTVPTTPAGRPAPYG
jgi:hypothetical protein